MNYKSIGLLINLFIGLAHATPTGDSQLLGIDAGRVMSKAENYKTLINRTVRNKRITWFSGGVLVSGCFLYLLTDGFSSADTTDVKKPKNTKKRSNYSDEAFDDWWEEEKAARSSVWGGARRGIAEGFKIGLVSIVVGLLLKAFDNATHSLSNFSDNILGCDEDVLFERVNRSVFFSFDCMAHSLRTLVRELVILTSGDTKSVKIPSFFYDSLNSDLQALSLQLEEHMALVFAIVSLHEKDSRVIGQAMEVMTSVIDDAVGYTMFLAQQGASVDPSFVKQEALIIEKKVFRSIERYLVTCKNVLFE